MGELVRFGIRDYALEVDRAARSGMPLRCECEV
jgi:hypothetical protein